MFGLPIIFQLYTFFTLFLNIEDTTHGDPEVFFDVFTVFPIIMLVFTLIFFGWFWSIAIGLQKQIPTDIKMKVTRFKIMFFIPLFYILLFVVFFEGILSNWFSNFLPESAAFVAILVPLHLFSMFCVFYSMYFVAKTIKTAELQKKVGFGDFAAEFFLLWFYIIGVWFIQPKVNRLYRGEMRN